MDLNLTEALDLEVRDGDLVIAESREQHTLLLLISAPGNWRASPLMGVAITQYINAPASDLERNATAQHIRRQMEADGLKPGIIEVDGDWNIEIS